MLKLDNVTLVLMSSVDIDKCIKVLELSSKDIEFGDIKFITHEKPNNLPNKIKYCFIDKINSIWYDKKLSQIITKYIDLIGNTNYWRTKLHGYNLLSIT